MNTIKFSNIYDLKKETNNVEVYDVKEIEIDNKIYNYYSNAQMCLFITKKCNANCKFCMNKYEDKICKLRESKGIEYFQQLEYVLDILKEINPFVTITGGEPTKSNRLIKVMELLKQKGYRVRTFSTNGSGLLDRYDGKVILQHMLDNNVYNNINISRMVIDDDKNKNIMHINLTNNDLRSIFTFGKTNGMDMRLSSNIMKDGIECLDDILNYHDFYQDLGVDTIIFRELIPIKKSPSCYKDFFIDMNTIFKEIAKDKRFIYLRTLKGMYYEVDVYRYKDKLVKCYHEVKRKLDKDVIREFVFYSNGELASGWNNDNILLKRK